MSALVAIAGDALAKATGLTSTQARGTVRLLLKERGIDPEIARKADVLGLLGVPLEAALAKRHVKVTADVFTTIRAAVAPAPEHEDALDLFEDID